MSDEEEPRRLVFYREDIERISRILMDFLKNSNSRCILLVDKDGHLITREGEAFSPDMDSMSALVAGSFDAMKKTAKSLGEDEFSILFPHEGKANIQLSLIGERTVFAVIFDEKTTLGKVRIYANLVSKKLTKIFDAIANRGLEGPDPTDGPGPSPLPA